MPAAAPNRNLPGHLKKQADDLKHLEDDAFIAQVWTKHRTNIKRMAKLLGVNVNLMAKAPPADLADLAHKCVTGFYTELSAGYAESSGLQICIARAQAVAMVEGMEAKYGRRLNVEVLKALVISRCQHIFKSGVSPQKAVDGWNGREQIPGVQVSAPGEKIGYQVYVKAYHTDDFDLATRLIRSIHALSAGSSAMVLSWAPEGGPVRCHALSVSHATDCKIIAMDHEGAGCAQEITSDGFAQLVIYNTCASTQDGEALTANTEYEAVMAVVAQMCEPIIVANDPHPDVMPRKFVVIGNPAAGKSTLLNCYAGERMFTSGVSKDLKGVTYQLDMALRDGVCFMDMPGLSDIARRTDAADAIDAALRQGGDFQIIFAMTLDEGRPKRDDFTTMKLVLDAARGQIPAEKFAIVINKTKQKILRKLDKDAFIQNLHKVCNDRNIALTHHIHFAPFRDELEDEDDAWVPLDDDTQRFLDGVPHIHIDDKSLDLVKTETFEQEEEEEDERAQVEQAHRDAEEKRVQEEREADEVLKQMRRECVAVRQREEQQERGQEARMQELKSICLARSLGVVPQLGNTNSLSGITNSGNFSNVVKGGSTNILSGITNTGTFSNTVSS